MKQPKPSLPLEILQSIVDCVRDDYSTLKSLSRTCRALVPDSQRHIFAKVHIPPHTTVSPLTRFANLITDKPVIATYVRHLSICIPSQHLCGLSQTRDNAIHTDLIAYRIAASILESLPNLESLACLGHRCLPPEWDDLGDMQEALHTAAALPTLRRLELDSICDVPYSLLATPRHITELSLSYCEMDPSSPYTASEQMIRLTSLTVTGSESQSGLIPYHAFSRLFLGPQALFDINDIEKLEIDQSDLGRFLESGGPSILQLRLTLNPQNDEQLDVSQWQRLPSLVYLGLRIDRCMHSGLPLTSGVLRRLPSPTLLKTFHVVLSIGRCRTIPSMGLPSGWLADLDTSARAFPNLEQIGMHLTVYGDSAFYGGFSSRTTTKADKLRKGVQKFVVNGLSSCRKRKMKLDVYVELEDLSPLIDD